MSTVEVVTSHVLNENVLAALLREAVASCPGAREDWPERYRKHGVDIPKTRWRLLKEDVLNELRDYGEASVECGPQRGWDDDDQMNWYLRQVRRAYQLEES